MTIFNYKDQVIDLRKSIAPKKEASESLIVKISEDFTKCVLGSMEENYMLTQSYDPNGNVYFCFMQTS